MVVFLRCCFDTILTGGVVWCCRATGPMEFESLKNNVILDLEKTEEKLMHR